VFLAIVSIAAALGFLVYGGRLFLMLRRFPVESRGRTKKLREVCGAAHPCSQPASFVTWANCRELHAAPFADLFGTSSVYTIHLVDSMALGAGCRGNDVLDTAAALPDIVLRLRTRWAS
jgi:Protein of unknown function (DUF1084)